MHSRGHAKACPFFSCFADTLGTLCDIASVDRLGGLPGVIG